MKRIFILFFSLVICVPFAWADSYTFPTYYPSPSGSYTKIRLVPKATADAPECDDDSEKGLMYYDSDMKEIRLCKGVGGWGGFGGLWVLESDNLYPAATLSDPNLYVGIGRDDPPLARFYHSGPSYRDGILAKGTFGRGAQLQTSGAGTRFIWYSAKGAFRAGRVTGNQWDDIQVDGKDNIGDYSFATGYNTRASGAASFASGSGTTASGRASAAMGKDTTASGEGSFAVGLNTVASGRGSAAFGEDTTASGEASLTMGHGTTASNTAAVAMGEFTTASGFASAAFGSETEASGDYSFVSGRRTKAAGFASAAFGISTEAYAMGSLAVGLFNEIPDPLPVSDTPDPDDPIFVVGNGVDEGNRSNALTVLRNGRVGVGIFNPSVGMDINGHLHVLNRVSWPDVIVPECTAETEGAFGFQTAFVVGSSGTREGLAEYCDGNNWRNFGGSIDCVNISQTLSDGTQSVSASCQAGYVPTGGGCSARDNNGILVNVSGIKSGNGWQCNAINAAEVSVTTRCCRIVN